MVRLIHPGDHPKMENVARLEDAVAVAVEATVEAVVVVVQTKTEFDHACLVLPTLHRIIFANFCYHIILSPCHIAFHHVPCMHTYLMQHTGLFHCQCSL